VILRLTKKVNTKLILNRSTPITRKPIAGRATPIRPKRIARKRIRPLRYKYGLLRKARRLPTRRKKRTTGITARITKKKTTTIKATNIKRIRRRLKRRLRKTKGILTKNKSVTNIYRNSYFKRYLRCYPANRKARSDLYYRTYYFQIDKTGKYDEYKEHDEEIFTFNKLKQDIQFYESNPFRKKRFIYKGMAKPLYLRDFSLGRIYITSRRRNTFMTIEEIIQTRSHLEGRIIFKATGSTAGYKGPKKRTRHARHAVSEVIGAFIHEKGISTVDFVFIRFIRYRMISYVRNFKKTPIFLRHIIVKKRRTHGFTRRKKAKRK
jgi:hypothetical protein